MDTTRRGDGDRLSVRVADRIEKMLASRYLQVGDRLPSERRLSEDLGVSRTVVREATRILAARGLLEMRVGSGTYVTAPQARHANDSLRRVITHSRTVDGFEPIAEVRFALEVEIAGLAALRRTQRDLEAMEQAILAMEAASGEPRTFAEQDMAFHNALAAATRNELFSTLLNSVSHLLIEFRIHDYRIDSREAVEAGLKHHRAILAAVAAGDEGRAREAMRSHLAQGLALSRRPTAAAPFGGSGA